MDKNNFHLLDPSSELVVVDSLHSLSCTLEGNDILFVTFITQLLISLRFRTKQVIKVMRAKDKGDKKTDSNKYK